MTVLISFVPETAYAQGEQLHVHVYRCCKLLTTSGFSVSAIFTYTQAYWGGEEQGLFPWGLQTFRGPMRL